MWQLHHTTAPRKEHGALKYWGSTSSPSLNLNTTHVYTYTHVHLHTRSHTPRHTYMHSCTHAHTHPYTFSKLIYTHAHTNMLTRMCYHLHIYTYIQISSILTNTWTDSYAHRFITRTIYICTCTHTHKLCLAHSADEIHLE